MNKNLFNWNKIIKLSWHVSFKKSSYLPLTFNQKQPCLLYMKFLILVPDTPRMKPIIDAHTTKIVSVEKKKLFLAT